MIKTQKLFPVDEPVSAPTETHESSSLVSRSNPDALQFAGLLLGSAPEGAEVYVIMFTAASGGTQVRPLLARTAAAMKEIRACRVAVVHLSGRDSKSITPEMEIRNIGQNWKITSTGGVTVIRWDHGPEAGPSTVSASAFGELLARIREQFDFILVEAGPDPVSSSPQFFMLVPQCTGTVLVVRPGITTVQEIQRSQTLLSQAHARILGFAFVER